MYFILTKDINDELKKKYAKVKALEDQVCQSSVKIEEIEAQVSKTYDEIILLEDKKVLIYERTPICEVEYN